MKFDEAYDIARQNTPDDCIPKGNENFPKLLAFMWNMIKAAENVLDDTVYIANNNIVSIPDEEKDKGQTPKSAKKAATTKKEKKSDDKEITGNGEEKEEEPTESEQ